jgi:hypothetical protein
MTKKKRIPEKYQIWIEARKRYRLSDLHIQMARELGMNPKKFGKLANEKQEPWKAPLPTFIEDIYLKLIFDSYFALQKFTLNEIDNLTVCNL